MTTASNVLVSPIGRRCGLGEEDWICFLDAALSRKDGGVTKEKIFLPYDLILAGDWYFECTRRRTFGFFFGPCLEIPGRVFSTTIGGYLRPLRSILLTGASLHAHWWDWHRGTSDYWTMPRLGALTRCHGPARGGKQYTGTSPPSLLLWYSTLQIDPLPLRSYLPPSPSPTSNNTKSRRKPNCPR